MSPNVAKWIVYEKMKEPRLVFCHFLLASISNPHEGARESEHSYENYLSDEADLKQRQKLSKLVTEKYGPTNQNENVELIPEDISGRYSNADLWLPKASLASKIAPLAEVCTNQKTFPETDIREFHEQCLEIGIDLDRLERVPAPEIIPTGDRLTLSDFVKKYDKAQEE